MRATYHSEEDLVARLGPYNTPHVYYRSTVHRQQVVPDARVKLDCHKVSVVTPASLILSLAPSIREWSAFNVYPKRAKDRYHFINNLEDHNMSNVTPYLSSCVLLFCQPVFSDHYTAHIMYECTPNTVPETTQTGTVIKTASTTHTACHVCYRSTILTRVNAQTGPKNTQAGTVTNTTCTTKRSHRSPCVLPLDCPYPSVRKKYSSRDSDEHNMHDEISHRSPCVLPLDCPYPSVPKNTQAGTVTNTTCTTKDHTARDVCCRSTALPECTKEHSIRDSDEHNMHDEKITPPAMCAYRSLLPPKCTKEHLRENSDEHNMTTKRSHRPPCVLTAHCSRRSVPKNTSERTVTNTT
ncbi:hypothetical protein Bbelb_303260 [Branchiostoma belcheri]|nr:hypothetical protein Bbelb_303260 [Branchiostoma belcheri]